MATLARRQNYSLSCTILLDLASHSIGTLCQRPSQIFHRWPPLEWVDWYNNRRLFEALGDIPPAEAESACYATMTRPRALEWQNKPSTELGAVQLGA